MIRSVTLALVAGIAFTGVALADPIEGNWKTEKGTTAKISACGTSFCIKLISGSNSGKQIGKMTKDGDEYKGTITDPDDNKTYNGKAWLASPTSLKMRGYSGIFFKTQTWPKA